MNLNVSIPSENISFHQTAFLQKSCLAFLFLLITCSSYAQSVESKYRVKVVKAEMIFTNPPFKACHASTLVETNRHELLLSCFGGSHEGADDVGIWLTHSRGKAWETPVEVITSRTSDTTAVPCWNPVLFNTGKCIYLFYKQGKNPREWWGAVTKSTDQGKTWSPGQLLPAGFLGPIKNKPVKSPGGKLICPSSTESLDNQWNAHTEITDMDLKHWVKTTPPPAPQFGIIQPTLLVYGKKLQMLCRSRQNAIVESWSNDNGNHWSFPQLTSVPNPNSGIDAATLKNGWQVLVYNPLLSGAEWYNGRNILKVAVSENGEDWKDVYTLENQVEGEFSYPAVIVTSDNLVHITYTYDRKNIKHVVLEIK